MEKRNDIFMGDQKIHAGNVFLFFCIVSFRVRKKLIFTAFCE